MTLARVPSAGANCIVAGWIESTREGVKKSLEQIILMLNKRMNKPPGSAVVPFHLICSSNRACNVNDNKRHIKM